MLERSIFHLSTYNTSESFSDISNHLSNLILTCSYICLSSVGVFLDLFGTSPRVFFTYRSDFLLPFCKTPSIMECPL